MSALVRIRSADGHTLRNELIHRRDFQAREEAKPAIFEHIEVFYNRIRQHTTIGNLSHVNFELQRAKAA